MIRVLLPLAVCVATAASAHAQDPQSVLNALIQQEMQKDQIRQQNEMMRLQMERIELEEELQLRQATDLQIGKELSRYCPTGEPPCSQTPPDSLLQEAARRGLIRFETRPQAPGRPALGCITMGDGLGGGITDCD